jgi:hypothetical protein
LAPFGAGQLLHFGMNRDPIPQVLLIQAFCWFAPFLSAAWIEDRAETFEIYGRLPTKVNGDNRATQRLRGTTRRGKKKKCDSKHHPSYRVDVGLLPSLARALRAGATRMRKKRRSKDGGLLHLVFGHPQD